MEVGVGQLELFEDQSEVIVCEVLHTHTHTHNNKSTITNVYKYLVTE